MIDYAAMLLCLLSSLQVKTLGDQGFELSFSMEQLTLDGYISFPDAKYLNKEGEPALPSLLYKIGLPQDGDVEIQIIEVREEKIRDVEIEPVFYTGIPEPQVHPTDKVVSEVYRENRFFPTELVQTTEPAYYRDIYVVDLRLNPLQYNPVTKELKVFRKIRIRVNFKKKPVERPVIDDSFEEIYKRTILNYEQCKSWRREPLRNGTNPFSSGVWFKIEVSEEGIYRIGYDEIVAAGLDPEQFDPRTMKIYTASFDLLPRDVTIPSIDSLVEVPVYVEGEDDLSFDRNDYLIFYAFPASHLIPDTAVNWFENGYALNNVYWFTFGGEEGRRMELIDAAWDGSEPDSVVQEVIHMEEDVSNPTRSGTNWYWLDISPGTGQLGSGELVLRHPDARGSADITVGIYTLQRARFVYQFALDDVVFYNDTFELSVQSRYPPHYITAQTSISGDSSILSIDLIRATGTSASLTAYLNSVDIEYERLADLDAPFHAFYPGPLDYSIKVVDAGDTPFILDITDLREPRMLDNYNLNNGEVILSSSSDSFQLLYFSKYSLAKKAELIQATPGELREQSSGCEYLVITHEDFYHAISPLVEYRSKDYSTKVVEIHKIYDDFSFGKYDPLAIKHFLYYTTNNWTTVPKYILLVGDATYDYKNNLGKDNPPNYIPMYEWGTQLAGNPGIPPNNIDEGEYVNFGGGESMILSRITVRTKQEVRDFIDKLITYETKDIDGMWNRRIILAGDDEWSNSNHWENPISYHCGACERLSTHIPDSLYDFAKVYMISYPPFAYPTHKPTAQDAFIRELNKSFFIGAFFGHGNTHQLADEGLFYDTNIPLVKNGRRYFFFFFGSCTVGRFDDSDYECIAEQLVRKKEGAIGTMAETAGSSSWTNELIADSLFSLMTRTDLTMGECFRITEYGEYVLLGDPATKMRRVNNATGIQAYPDSVRPMEKLKITSDEERYYLKAFVRDTTHIEKFDPSTADRISGHVYRLVQIGDDPPSFVGFDYKINGKKIYEGFWSQDTAVIFAPKIVTTHLPVIKLSNFIAQKSGVLDSIRVFGTASPSADEVGPEVVFYDGARRLKDGDWVDQEFTLTGRVSDESGINLLNSVESSRGFYLYINDETEKTDLRDYFIYDRNSFTAGEFTIDVILPESVDTLTVNVSDNYYNQTVEKIVLNAEIYERIKIDNFLVYPNPLQGEGGLWFTFDLHSSGVVTIKIFTVAGRLIKTIRDVPCSAGYNQIYWDVLDEYSDEISNGVYLVKAFVRGDGSQDEVIEKFIIAR